MRKPAAVIFWSLFGIGLVLPLALSLYGSGIASPADLFSAAFRDSVAGRVFWGIRIPRVLLGYAAGAALALAGLVFQAVFRNPLATPFTLGVSSGAACGAAIAVQLGLVVEVAGFSSIPLFAFLGAVATILLVFGLASACRDLSTEIMLLTGVALSFFFSAVIMFIQYLSDFTGSYQLVRWLMGDLNTAGYFKPLELLILTTAGSVPVIFHARALNLLLAGDDFAQSRGVNVTRSRVVLLGAVSLVTGGVVALCGPIGFVGMMIPHMLKIAVGSDHVRLVPLSLAAGGAFLALCDWAARTLIAPAEIPVGILTALLGGPFFLWMLIRARRGLLS
jgi:iron complex transport system permease protein